ncbi:MAG: hypothetical protein GXY44_10550 [Phycisphaerales bacterium]|nr:hypothetical protein [Phycisphaerales bacterium]
MSRRNLTISVFLAICCIAWPCLAQNRRVDAFSGSPLGWDLDPIMDVYVSNISRHYNLDDSQKRYTQALLTRRVKDFLKNYEKDVRDIMAEYMTYQVGQKVPPPEVAKEFAQRAEPLIEAMKHEIYEGNKIWRQVLNDQQKQIHDRDLKQMDQFFDNLTKQIENWSQGKVEPLEPTGRPTVSRPLMLNPEDAWDYYVNSFVYRYGLDQGQRETAFSILRELKDEARRLREARGSDFERIENHRKELNEQLAKQDGTEAIEEHQKKILALNADKQRLEAPINGLFNKLKDRLETIPNADQRRAYSARMAGLKRFVDKKRESETQPATETQPASETQPAKVVAQPS